MSISAAEYLRRSKSVSKISVLREMAYAVIKEEEVSILNLKEQDFSKGDIYGDGTRVAYRSPAYEAYKYSLNPLAGGNVDLMLSHDFIEAMFIKKPMQSRYVFENHNWKRNILDAAYPKGIFGLNQTVFDNFQSEVLAPKFINMIKQKANIG